MIRLIEIILSSLVIVQGLPEVKISFDEIQKVIDEVNAKQTTWTAGNNFGNNHKNDLDLSYTVGALLKRGKIRKNITGIHDDCESSKLPTNFDARQQWKECSATLEHVYDQGNCGSCWAVSTVSAFTDRLCIKSKGKETILRSIQQLLSCEESDGCDGGYPSDAWDYLVSVGETTGGDYHSEVGCQPYLIPPSAHHVNTPGLVSNFSKRKMETPACKHQCYNSHYNISYKKDKVKAISSYDIDDSRSAQHHIFKKGPIVTSLDVYVDLYTYKSGVYQHVSGDYKGSHAVRVLGWGVEKNVSYWLVVNSWSKSWGDNGTFKILRGSDECGFEDNFTAGDV